MVWLNKKRGKKDKHPKRAPNWNHLYLSTFSSYLSRSFISNQFSALGAGAVAHAAKVPPPADSLSAIIIIVIIYSKRRRKKIEKFLLFFLSYFSLLPKDHQQREKISRAKREKDFIFSLKKTSSYTNNNTN